MKKDKIKIDQLNKRYFTNQEMIKVLNERGLCVDEPTILDQINYAYLIYEFSCHFYSDSDKLKYKKGIKLSDIYNFYIFHKKFSIFLFEYIHDVEQRFKRFIASLIAKKGAYKYLKEEFYKKNNEKGFGTFLKQIEKKHTLILKDKNFCIKQIKDGIIPIWLFVNHLDLGTLIKFVAYCQESFAKKLYKNMKVTSEKMLIISKFRNQIAHMNPVKESIILKIKKDNKNFYYKDFIKAINAIIPTFYKELSKFWKQEKRLVHWKIRNIIKDIFFNFS